MTRSLIALLAVLTIGLAPRAGAVSAVFDGDPVDPSSGHPYEILPGAALVLPGADGLLGTADDLINPTITGDIDMAVRAGNVAAATVIPAPALAGPRNALPHGTAGPQNAGGVEIPFTVFLSDGASLPTEPAGRLLAAADVDGLPVIVAAFPDLDGDGFIGPTTRDAAGGADPHLELRELEPVGRAAALFVGGVAHGSLAVQAGLPASRGGLTVALVAMALTGPFDPAFFDGAIPSGPGIATALPFLPQRDLTRLIRDRAAPAGPDTTLQQLIQFAALPPPDVYTLPLDGSSASIDGAVIVSQSAVRVRFRDAGTARGANALLDRATLGTQTPARYARLRLVPVDRFDNPADPPAEFLTRLRADAPLEVVSPFLARRGRPFAVRGPSGIPVLVRIPRDTAGSAFGTLRAERDGIVVGALSYAVDARVDRTGADATVPSPGFPTIQAAVDGASDRNHDGSVVVAVRAGLYREHIVIGRALQLRGDGYEVTFIAGDGTGSVITATAPGVIVRGVTAVGGGTGFALAGSDGRLDGSRAWRNVGAGVSLSGAGSGMRESAAVENGGDGVRIEGGADAAVCADTVLRENSGNGLSLSSAAGVQLRRLQAVRNGAGGLIVTAAGDVVIDSNQSAVNFGSGIELGDVPGAILTGNVCAANDGDGLGIDRSDDISVQANALDTNNGYGLFLRRSAGADFAAAPGVQEPLGDNRASDNRKGDLFIRND